MNYVELSLLLLSMAVFLMAACTAPLLYQIYRLTKGLGVTQEMLQKRLPDILHNLDEAAATMKLAVNTVNEQVTVVAGAIKRIQAIAGVLVEMESVLRLGLRTPLFVFLKNTAAVMKGVRVFLDVYNSSPRRLKG